MMPNTSHIIGKLLIASGILVSLMFVEVGGEGKATILSDQGAGAELLIASLPPVSPLSLPLTTVQLADLGAAGTSRSVHHLREHQNHSKELQGVGDKRKLGLMLMFLGMVAETR